MNVFVFNVVFIFEKVKRLLMRDDFNIKFYNKYKEGLMFDFKVFFFDYISISSFVIIM